MLTFAQKHFHKFFILLTGLLGVALGCLAAAVTGVYLKPPAAPAASAAPALPAPAKKVALQDFEIILQRNIFDSAAPGTLSLAAVESAEQSATASRAALSNLTLLGTVTAGRKSLAVVRTDGGIKIFKLDADLPGGGRIEKIERHLVQIKSPDGGIVTLRLHEGELSQESAAVQEPVAGEFQVRAAGENRWQIPAAEAERARSQIGELIKQARIEPNVVDGRTDGFMVKMVQPKSLLAQLGLQRGDLIRQVNGMEMNSPEKALQIVQQLREARSITVNVVRNGVPLTLSYEVN